MIDQIQPETEQSRNKMKKTIERSIGWFNWCLPYMDKLPKRKPSLARLTVAASAAGRAII